MGDSEGRSGRGPRPGGSRRRARARLAAASISAALAGLAVGCEARPILLWHSVGERVDPPRFVTREAFAAQLELVLAEGFTPVDAPTLDAIEDGRVPGPPRPIVLTFDDGYENFYLHAYPELRARGLAATMFLISDRVADTAEGRFVDARARYLVWPEVREMAAAGIDFQSHSVTHRNLKHLSDEELTRELVDSRAALERGLGRPVTVLAYPFGGNSPHTQDVVAAAGYVSAHSVLAGLGGQYARLRTSIGGWTTTDGLRAALRGSWFAEASELR
jgi:peptidoglycan/xylan/chitin deacetylase (PgdA/CDA1 family)